MSGKSRKNKKYGKELKLQAVQDYISGNGSLREICRRYEILSNKQLWNWIKVYNGHKDFKERSAVKGEIYMTKGRKTTQEERAEIVAFCIEHGKDYGLTVETYKVSYQQISRLRNISIKMIVKLEMRASRRPTALHFIAACAQRRRFASRIQ